MTSARAVVTLCSTPRVDHLRRQLAVVRRDPATLVVVVWVGDDDPPALDADEVLRVPPGPHGLRLAAARNAGADRAVALGADLVVLLDADCVPGPGLLDRYAEAAAAHPAAVLCGPVTYLPPGAVVDDPAALAAATRPHPARPAPADGVVQVAGDDEYDLFWSLSFALTARRWADGPRFDEGYEGYGGEDTDFGYALRDARVPLAWVGGAHAYHQHHPTSSPPWQHLDDVLRNGARFARRWGRWPMEGWLRAFAAAGAVRWDGTAWHRA
ncbi:glycosyltransferase family 2 protein [Cellulosimicrobium cellulans]|uniref:glycosyltransferase family 2 protein n=1 Tax=Cellulosimicrobium cellulans TaxID=1710 RepID=UPI00130EFA65|nr:glycosyltransferase [Cellulosimicrobium cellulans]